MPVDDEATLVSRHAPLVKRIALHLSARLPPHVDLNDLIQSGMIGLLDAARHFQGDRGASFETYAGIRIRGAMIDELRQGDWAPRSVHRRMREVAEAIREIEQATGREAQDTEIADRLDLPMDAFQRLMQDATQCQVLSLDATSEEGDARFDVPDPQVSPLQSLEHVEFRQALAHEIGELPEREKLVLALYYDEQLNLKEIGAVLSVSESRVCQLHGQALLRLRSRLTEWKDLQAAA